MVPVTKIKLLLVEFLAEDPFDQMRSDLFPFIQGHGRLAGHAVQWVALEAGKSARETNPYVVEPPGPDRRLLAEAARQLGPTRIVLNEKIGPLLAGELRRACPRSQLLSLTKTADAYRTVSGLKRLFGRRLSLSWLHRLWSLPADRAAVDVFVPDYDRRVLNPGPLASRHFVRILTGPQCLYRRRVETNPHYAGLRLSTLAPAYGCAFCEEGHARGEHCPTRPALHLALTQICRYLETAPPEGRSHRFVIVGLELLFQLDAFLQRLRELSLPPSRFYFNPRADDLLRCADRLERCLPALKEMGHSIHLWSMGVESFSEVENERLNKGIKPQQIFAAHDLLTRLEQKWPDTFSFHEQGGFSLIMFTPWTTLDDIESNLQGLRRIGHPSESLLQTSRLQLIRGTPIALLARRDGLTVRSFSDHPFLAFPCQRRWDWGRNEIPWRFKNEDVAAIYQILIRVSPSPLIPEEDSLFRAVRRLLQKVPRERRNYRDVLAASVRIARQQRGQARVENLLVELDEELKRQSEEASAAAGAAEGRLSGGPARTIGEGLASLLLPRPGGDSPVLAGYRVARVFGAAIDGQDNVPAVELARGSSRLIVWLLPDDPARPAYLRAGGFRLFHDRSTPVDTADKRRAVGGLAQLLRRWERQEPGE